MTFRPPPPEITVNFDSNQKRELAQMMARPTVVHKIRMKNTSDAPLTTSPAIIVQEGRLLAQSMMTYTAIGAEVDLAITSAVDIQVIRHDLEIGRDPKGMRWNNDDYFRVDLTGAIRLTNFKNRKVQMEVRRYVLGNVASTTPEAAVDKLNDVEDLGDAIGGPIPSWWNSYNWPRWWHHFNGLGRITWKFELGPGDTGELEYAWSYYFR